MVTYRALLDVPRHVVEYLARLLTAHRRRIGTPRGPRALGPFRQAVLVLRWFRHRTCVHCLAHDADISQATGYWGHRPAEGWVITRVPSSPAPPCAGVRLCRVVRP
ncbi:hypothetical protein [Streptomyces carminius]|uniref:hypothetical protein n=1 Tax=Streptomyces carminius TaxID=2665496 RepID=UPI0018EE1576|nr:hypothetical protein [Streptomyces carminius]